MTVADYVNAYALGHDIVPGTIKNMGAAVRALDRWHGHSTDLADLSDDLINRWIAARLAAGIARPTIKGQRATILTLWRSAADEGLCKVEPRRVKIVRVFPGNPDAWWPDQMAKLLMAAATMPGRFKCGLKRALLLRAWLLVGYYSLLRPCDLMKLTRSDVRPDGGLLIPQDKTRNLVARYLPPDAMEALAAIKTESELLFPVSEKAMRIWWKCLKTKAGVPGSPKWLRRTGATACEVQQRGSAMHALGHKTPGLADKHYIDKRQLPERPVTPPRIT